MEVLERLVTALRVIMIRDNDYLRVKSRMSRGRYIVLDSVVSRPCQFM
jgi:hypothetical protein